MSTIFEINDFVWVKMRGHPHWPGIVIEPVENAPSKPRGHAHFIYFFGSRNYAWMQPKFLKPYEPYKVKYLKKCSQDVKGAYQELEFHSAKLAADENYKIKFPPLSMKTSRPGSSQSTASATSTTSRKTASSPGADSLSSRRSDRSSSVGSFSTRASVNTPRPESSQSTSSGRPRGRRRGRNHSDTDSLSSSKRGRRSSLTPTRASFRASIPNDFDDHVYSGYVGVLACNIYAFAIVKKLIHKKHNVVIWSTSPHVCADLQEAATEMGNDAFKVSRNLKEVAAIAGIIFGCFSTADDSKVALEDLCKNGFPSGRFYIETTNISHEQSYRAEEIMEANASYYMEAMIYGNPHDIMDRSCVILLAGSDIAWNLIHQNFMSCFGSLTEKRSSIRMVGETGMAIKVHSILCMMKAVWIVGFNEVFCLIDKIMNKKNLPSILGEGKGNKDEIHPLHSRSVMQNCSTIANDEYLDIRESIPILQENLQKMLSVSETFQEPLLMASTANQVFKLARRLGFDNLDASFLFQVLK